MSKRKLIKSVLSWLMVIAIIFSSAYVSMSTDNSSLALASEYVANNGTEANPPYSEMTNEYKTDRFIVKYTNDNGKDDIANSMKDKIKGTKQVRNVKNKKIEVVTTKVKMKPEDFVSEIKSKKADKNIEYIQSDYEMVIASNDIYSNRQWGIYNTSVQDSVYGSVYAGQAACKIDVNAAAAWEQSTGNGIVVAVVDTGIDITHEDLSSNIWNNPSEIPGNGLDDDGNGYVDDVSGWNFPDGTNEVHRQDSAYDEWHGTLVAGIIAAVKDNGKGVAGVAPSAKILALKVFKNGIAYTSDIISAIDYAASMDAKVVNCSWGTTNENQALKEAIEDSGLAFVCAAGNSGLSIDASPVYPASFSSSNIITAASINKEGALSSFSNYGEASVDAAAPGEDIMSTVPGNAYGQSSGTSMATAFVTGELALLFSRYGDMSINAAKDRIINTSDRLSSLIGKVCRGNKINCVNALNNMSSSEIIQVIQNNPSSTYGNTNQGDGEYTLYAADTWTVKANMPTKRGNVGAVAVNGRIYAVGGGCGGGYSRAVEEYNPITDTWTAKENMPTARENFRVTALNGKIYAVGGWSAQCLNVVEEYDPVTNTWIFKNDMPTARYGLALAALDGKLYAIGGCNSATLNTVEVYDPTTDTWTTKASMLTPRYAPAVEVVNGKIYVIGGALGSNYLTSVEMYDPVSNTWKYKASMPTGRCNFSAAMVSGKIFTFGGWNGSFLGSTEEYNALTDQWTVRTNMLTSRYGLGAAAVNSKVYAIGGTNGNWLNAVEEYDTGIPGTPSNVSSTSTDSSVAVSWDTVSGLSYDIRRDNTVITNVASTYTDTVKLPQSTILQEDFNDAVANGWTLVDNGYSLNDKVLKVKDPVGRVVVGESSWNASVVEAKVLVSSWTPDSYNGNSVGLLARYTDTKNYYAFIYNLGQGKFKILKKTNGSFTTIGTAVSGTLSLNTWYTFTAEFEMDYATFYVNGQAVCYGGGNEYNAPGKVGLMAGGSTYTSFDDFNVISYSTPVENKAYTVVNNDVIGTGMNQFNYQGDYCWTHDFIPSHASPDYLGDRHESGYVPGIAEMSFNGTQIQLYSYRTSWAGKAAVSIDGGAETVIDYYSPNDFHNSLMYTSPVLTAGNHTFRFRVLGDKNPASMGNWVFIDKVVITGSAEQAQTDPHTYEIRAKNSYGTGNWSPVLTASALPNPPGIPADITITAASTAITVAWSPTAGATGYDIEKDSTVVSDITGTSYTHTGLTPGTQHTYRVRAKNTGGTGSWSTVTSKSTVNIPANLRASASGAAISVEWDSVTGAVGYDIQVDGVTYDNGTNTSYSHANLELYSSHSYKVRARIAGDTGDWSSPLEYQLIPEAAGTPANLNAVASSSKITVMWDSVAGATGYDIEVDGTAVSNGVNTTYTHGNLSANSTHTYRVRAKNIDVPGQWSQTITKTAMTPDTWSVKADMSTERGGAAIVSLNGKVYAIGGKNSSGYLGSVEEYNPVTDTWTGKASMSTARAYLGAAVVNGKIYAIGGYNGSCLNTVEEYDPVSDSWTTKASMTTARRALGVTAANGRIYAIGGDLSNAKSNAVEEYNPATNSWSTKANMPTARGWLGAVTVNGLIYAVGGCTLSSFNPHDPAAIKLERYDPAANTWTSRADMPVALYKTGVATVNNRIYIIGGFNGSGSGGWVSDAVQEYNTATNMWSLKEEMPSVRCSLGVAEAYGKLFAAGGADELDEVTLDSVEEYVPPMPAIGVDHTEPCTIGKVFNYELKASNMKSFDNRTFVITYDSSQLDVLDLCAATAGKETTACTIAEKGITITQVSPGAIAFTVSRAVDPDKVWSGVINSIRFRAKVNVQTVITCSVQ